MKLNDLIKDLTGQTLQSNPCIERITCDSRQVKPKTVFAALKGQNVNGADYIQNAIENGAQAVITGYGNYCENIEKILKNKNIPHIKTENPRYMLAKITGRLYPLAPRFRMAVTGTNGKTSTADFVKQIMAYNNIKCATIGTLGVWNGQKWLRENLTTPEAVTIHKHCSELKKQNCEHLIIEASSHALDQYRLDGLDFDIAAFTNLSQDHFDYHQNIENYFDAKKRLFTQLMKKKSSAKAVIFESGKYAQKLQKTLAKQGTPIITAGIGKGQLSATDIKEQNNGQIVTIKWQPHDKIAQQKKIYIPLTGRFQLCNILLAMAITLADEQLQFDEVSKAVSHLVPIIGRLDHCANYQGAKIYVDYAHTPQALEAALLSLRNSVANKLNLVFGCGGDRDKHKRPIMGKIAQELADEIYVTDDNPRYEDPAKIRQQIIKTCKKAKEFNNRKVAVQTAIAELQKGDALLVAGKGHEKGQNIKGVISKMDDYQIINDIISNIAK